MDRLSLFMSFRYEVGAAAVIEYIDAGGLPVAANGRTPSDRMLVVRETQSIEDILGDTSSKKRRSLFISSLCEVSRVKEEVK